MTANSTRDAVTIQQALVDFKISIIQWMFLLTVWNVAVISWMVALIF